MELGKGLSKFIMLARKYINSTVELLNVSLPLGFLQKFNFVVLFSWLSLNFPKLLKLFTDTELA